MAGVWGRGLVFSFSQPNEAYQPASLESGVQLQRV